ncbi:MAG: CPBP family intramembrane metalloprotease, partial [Chloroflexi bacterium]|nr:CPBP family intramembrane metalloprotease [Chloroflexota bacterium]
MNTKISDRQNLIQFFSIAFAISWLLWLPGLLVDNQVLDLPPIVDLLGMFAPFGPMIAAFWLTYRHKGRAGMKQLWLRAWRLRFEKKWLLPALFLGLFTTGATVGLIILMGGGIEWEHGLPLAALGPVFALIFVTNALPEEFGWRGYALGRLQNGSNALVASLILGAIWGLWHLPLHFMDGTVQEIIPIYQFVLQQMVLAIIYTWLFNNTGGSVLIATLFHTTANLSAAAVPFWTTELGRWLNF